MALLHILRYSIEAKENRTIKYLHLTRLPNAAAGLRIHTEKFTKKNSTKVRVTQYLLNSSCRMQYYRDITKSYDESA